MFQTGLELRPIAFFKERVAIEAHFGETVFCRSRRAQFQQRLRF
jgi:hypothetical protein